MDSVPKVDKLPYRPMTVVDFRDLCVSNGMTEKAAHDLTVELFVNRKCILLKPEFKIEGASNETNETKTV